MGGKGRHSRRRALLLERGVAERVLAEVAPGNPDLEFRLVEEDLARVLEDPR